MANMFGTEVFFLGRAVETDGSVWVLVVVVVAFRFPPMLLSDPPPLSLSVELSWLYDGAHYQTYLFGWARLILQSRSGLVESCLSLHLKDQVFSLTAQRSAGEGCLRIVPLSFMHQKSRIEFEMRKFFWFVHVYKTKISTTCCEKWVTNGRVLSKKDRLFSVAFVCFEFIQNLELSAVHFVLNIEFLFAYIFSFLSVFNSYQTFPVKKRVSRKVCLSFAHNIISIEHWRINK